MNNTSNIPTSLLVISGVLTGAIAIVATSLLRSSHTRPAEGNGLSSSAQDPASANPEGSSRLRRSRHVRRRRARPAQQRRPTPDTTTDDLSLLQVHFSDSEEDVFHGTMSLFKEWSDDDNKNLLNIIYAISENQARKGMQYG